eukprot:4934766-Prymnesium_polylepis.1
MELWSCIILRSSDGIHATMSCFPMMNGCSFVGGLFCARRRAEDKGKRTLAFCSAPKAWVRHFYRVADLQL